LEDLRQNLNESGNLIASYESIITEQEKLLANLRAQLHEMSETYRQQSALSAKSEQRLKFWKTFTIIGIPTAALISGIVVWAVN
jgi:DNA gyrase/topoisomerase IV subunit A